MARKKELPDFYTARGMLQMQLQKLGKTPKANLLVLNIVRTSVDASNIDITFSQLTNRVQMLCNMIRWVPPGTHALSVSRTENILRGCEKVRDWWVKNYGQYT